MPKISIVTSGHFSNNPRVWKEADALAEAGFEVTVIGVSFDPTQADLDKEMLKTRSWRYQAAVDLRPTSFIHQALRNWYRLRTELGNYLTEAIFNDKYSLGYAVDRLLASARHEKANLTIVHLEPAFWVSTQLHREGFRIGADFEDWHSENYVPGTISQKKLDYYRRLEQQVIKISKHVTTTSTAIARALSETFCVATPVVIYNSIWSVNTTQKINTDDKVNLLWFSQTLGPGRGLEDIFLALPQLKGNWRLDLIANCTTEASRWLEKQVPSKLRSRVLVQPTVPPDQLADLVSKYDIGLALEAPNCRNKNLTTSNKIFQYLQSGLLVIASDTEGQREVMSMIQNAGEIYRSGDISALVDILNRWIEHPDKLTAARSSISQKSNELFSYENQIPLLVQSVKNALNQ